MKPMDDMEAFEQRLQALKPRELPPQWREEILDNCSASGLPTAAKPAPSMLPPRWLMWSWGGALAATVVLRFLTAEEPLPARTRMAQEPVFEERAALMQALVAQN